jgi:hypothetical protein
MGCWGRSARRLVRAGALALALTAAAAAVPGPDLGGWGQPGAPRLAFGYAPPPGGQPPAGGVRARPPGGWRPASLPGGEVPSGGSELASAGGAMASGGTADALLGVVGYKPAVLVRLDPRTLRPLPGPRVRLRYGISGYGWSPDRSLLALGDVDDDALHLVDPVRLRRLATIRFGIVAEAPQSFAWLGPRRLAVVAGSSEDGSTLIMVDPVARRVLSRRRLEPAGISAVGAVDRLVLLRAPLERIGPVGLLVVEGSGRIRTVDISGIHAGFRPPPDWDQPGAYGVGRGAALAVDPQGGRAFVVAADAPVAEVDLASLRVTYRRLRQPASLLRRLAHWLVPPAEAKLNAGNWRSACWLGDGSLAVWGEETSIVGDTPAEQRVDRRLSGLKLIDTRSWTVRTLDAAADMASWQAGRLLAYGGAWDHEVRREHGVGLTLYGPGDRPAQHLLGTRAVIEAHLNGDLAYAAVDTGDEEFGRVIVSRRSGRVVASSEEPLPFLLLGERGPTC